MCCQATKPCMGSLACNLLKLVQALPGTPHGRAAVYRAGPQAGRLGWLSRPGRAPTKWDVAHSLDARPHTSTLHHCGPVVQWPRRASIISRKIQSTLLYKVGLTKETQPVARLLGQKPNLPTLLPAPQRLQALFSKGVQFRVVAQLQTSDNRRRPGPWLLSVNAQEHGHHNPGRRQVGTG